MIIASLLRVRTGKHEIVIDHDIEEITGPHFDRRLLPQALLRCLLRGLGELGADLTGDL
jgi:hypothetical protein